jgi:hypothetical protein
VSASTQHAVSQRLPDIDVIVGPDGSFSPQHVVVKDGQAVTWHLSSPSDGIVPSSATKLAWPGMCSEVSAYGASPGNDFSGPAIKAASGVFALSPFEYGLEEHETLRNGLCANRREGIPLDPSSPTSGPYLCEKTGEPAFYGKSRDATWQSPEVKGVFIRLSWSDLQPTRGTYDFTVLDREVAKAVQNGKLYSLTIKAGAVGTPDWIFSTDPPDPATPTIPGSPRPAGKLSSTVPRVIVDVNEDGNSCGWKSLGDPGNATYQTLYNGMLTAVATRLKSNVEWYRRLAYVKPSGANASSAEWRLPNGCKSEAVGHACGNVPSCNNEIWHRAGYTPEGLEAFHSRQLAHIATQFPGKTMSYQLIHAGFPRANATGGPQCWMDADLNHTCSAGTFPGTSPSSQTESLLAHGRDIHGLDVAVQHNGLGGEPAPCAGVPFAPGATGCPNWWAWDAGNRPLPPGALGQITGYQTSNPKQVAVGNDLQAVFENLASHSDGVFLEIYEEVLWRVSKTNKGVLPGGLTIRQWSDELDSRRRAGWPTATTQLPDPAPATHRFVFTRTAAPTNQIHYYVHSTRCEKSSANVGSVLVVP